MPREILKFFKAPRQAEDYDGDFPSTITARRSMFDMPRYKQGQFIADMSNVNTDIAIDFGIFISLRLLCQ